MHRVDDRLALKRLLPRHVVPGTAVIDWNLTSARTGWRRAALEPASRGTLVDVSLEGALVEVPDDQEHEIGDRVLVELAGVRGTTEVRHRRLGYDGYLLYGLRSFGGTDLTRTLARAVDELRDDVAQSRARPRVR